MPEGFLAGLGLAIVAGFCNGAFMLPQRYVRGWQWENMWIVFASVSQVLLPWIVASFAIPDLGRVLRDSPREFLLPGIIAGLIWGMGMVTYGLGVKMIGVAAGNALVASMSIVAGSLGPLIVYTPEKILTSVGLIFFAALALIVGGIYIYGKVGVQREKEGPVAQEAAQGTRSEFRAGLIACLVTGVLGTAFIYGFASSTELVKGAVNAGARPSVAGYVVWAVIFSTGYISNLGYSLYRMKQNHTAGAFTQSGHFLGNSALACLMAALWYGGVLMYGTAAGALGRLGPSVGSGIYISGTVLFANLLGWMAGEWRGASPGVIRGYVKGLGFIVAGITVMAAGIAFTG